MIEHVVLNPKWEPGMDTILDFREVDIKSINFINIFKTKDIHVQFNDMVGAGKIAAIFCTNLGFIFSRLYEAISNRHVKSRIMTFRDYENGMEWIQRSKYRDN